MCVWKKKLLLPHLFPSPWPSREQPRKPAKDESWAGKVVETRIEKKSQLSLATNFLLVMAMLNMTFLLCLIDYAPQ
jgi:hypothetical protein